MSLAVFFFADKDSAKNVTKAFSYASKIAVVERR